MRVKSLVFTFILISAICLLSADMSIARSLYDPNADDGGQTSLKPMADPPNRQWMVHNIGKLAMTITNYGVFGTGYISGAIIDGEIAPSAEYPINSDLSYLFTGALWIGAIVGRDTLVSGGNDGWAENTPELQPDVGEPGSIIIRSSLASRPDFSSDAISEQDYVATFTDTNISEAGIDGADNRPHVPLNIAIKQSSYAWSYDYAEDFILFDYKITNIGIFPIRQLYMAFYVDADVHHTSVTGQDGSGDDICGFRRTVKMPAGYGFDKDTVNIAWIADNDGDPADGGGSLAWSFTSPVAVTGTRVVRSPNKDLKQSFNWWISNGSAALDFGPRKAGTDEDPFRPFGAHLGTPTGDKTKYYIMSHEEFDYDQLFCALSHTSDGFLPPPRPSQATDFADGYDTRYLLSFGPFDVDPGDTLPITIAYIAGDDFHNNPTDFEDYFDAFDPNAFYGKLDFDDFGANARWASWVYDNPGYDTDGDGDSGSYNWVCQGVDSVEYYPEDSPPDDSIMADCTKKYYAGDGVADFRGAAPPPPPTLKVYPDFGKVMLRWNGQASENAIDVFSGMKDFEGYRVYMSLTKRDADFVLLTSFDLDDYKRLEFNTILRAWEQTSAPFTLDSLKSLYGPLFEPLDYFDETHYFTDNAGRIFYFNKQDWNESDISDQRRIHKVYPLASKTDSSDTTDEGWLRYYEYEYAIENLQPSIPYHFSVTAFDFGSLNVELGALESSRLVNAVEEFPLPGTEVVENDALEVMVYPNPYRIDGGYAAAGYENRDRTKSAERTRKINFANLPNICTIRIFSIDGDLIKEIEHYYPNGGSGSQQEEWDVISRNTQSVVTGIYLWHVESDMGEQIGKLVIMK
ncbi:MAG: hypothetical protein KAR42_13240 [candidate division Zixibacteria bacterium]|nr:hypothetical protein [candidate division Zixibacteria bacterium]